MPAGTTVRPGKWSNVIDLYDDGGYSAVWGVFDNNPYSSLGVRWNESHTDVGYPSLFGHPQWYVEPDFATAAVLNTLLAEVLKTPTLPRHEEYKQNIITALSEFERRIRPNGITRIIALYGASQTGKTPTLNELILLLEQQVAAGKAERVETTIAPVPGDPNSLLQDRKACYKFRSLTVGISTGGDDANAMDASFKFFERYNCDIGFTATRKRSDSSSDIMLQEQVLAKRLQRVNVPRTIEPVQSAQATVNQQQAKALFDMIKL